MSTKPQRFVPLVALNLALALGTLSCGSAPAVNDDGGVRGENRAPAAPGSSADGSTPLAPAPIGEVARPVPSLPGSGAVIHNRPRPAPVLVPDRSAEMAELAAMRHRGWEHSQRFEFALAASVFRELRDHPATPRAMRRQVHVKVNENDDLAHAIRDIRQALDRGDYALATVRYQKLSAAHPEIPLAAAFDYDSIRLPHSVR